MLWFELITPYRGTHTAAPNFAYALAARALARADGLDLSSLRFALNGAEPIDVTAVRQFLAAGAPFRPAGDRDGPRLRDGRDHARGEHPGAGATVRRRRSRRGRTWRSAIVARPAADGAARRAPFPRLGPPLDDIEIEVRDAAGAVQAEREVGTLFIRGPAVTDRYLTVDGERPTQGDDGWLDTGDVGYLVDGEVVVCGRVKDVIIMGGRNIYPTDIERVADAVSRECGPATRSPSGGATGGRRESFVVAVESRQADDPAEAARIAAAVRAAVTGDDRRAPGGSDRAAGRVDPEDTVGQAATGRDGEADHLKLHVATAYRGNPERAQDVRAAPPAEGTRS